ncbi:MAG: hypothetical protein IPN19_03125 [Elusimicrobia bacterium]|nr:hypothetical protein [Elusimicrobiota bacterium]
MNVFIVVLGSFRQRDQVGLVLEQIDVACRELSFVREAFISTTDDRETAEECLGSLARKIRLVQSTPPPFTSHGHRLHQMLQLHNALEGIPEDAWVLKLRTDKLILPSALMTECLRQVAEDPARYENRFGVLEGHLFVPWFVNDMAFLGQARTLREIVSFDISPDIFVPTLFTEQAIWSSLAGSQRRDFFSALKNFPLLHRLDSKGMDSECDRTLSEAVAVLRHYWEILDKKFFSISNHRFREPYSLAIGGYNVKSDRIFSRYGLWGASFADPSVVRDLLSSCESGRSVFR